MCALDLTNTGPLSQKLVLPQGWRIVEIDFRKDPRWEAFVTTHPAASVFQHPAWLQVLVTEYRRQPIVLACEDAEGRIHGILPLLETRGLPFNWGTQLIGRRVSSLPRTPVAGPLSVNRETSAALVRAAVELVRGKREATLQLKTKSNELDGLIEGVVEVPWKQSFLLEIPESGKSLHFGNSRNHARIKWSVTKASKMGVVVRGAETNEDLRAWYQLYLDTMRHHASVPRPYRFFMALWEHLRPLGLMRLLLAEHHEGGRRRLLAGSIFLMYGRTVIYYVNGCRREDLAFRPNDVIQFQAIQDACREGFRRYDFGEVEEGQVGLIDFKAKWGAKPIRSYRYYYPAPPHLHPPGAEPPSRRHLAHKVWRRLPLKATALIGDWIYSFL